MTYILIKLKELKYSGWYDLCNLSYKYKQKISFKV